MQGTRVLNIPPAAERPFVPPSRRPPPHEGWGWGWGCSPVAWVGGALIFLLVLVLLLRGGAHTHSHTAPSPPPGSGGGTTPPPPPTPVPAVVTGFYLAVDGRPDLDSASSVVVTVCGAADEGVPDSRCLSADTETAGVRCCAPAGSTLAPRSSCCDEYACAAGAVAPCACPEWGDDFTRCRKASRTEAAERCTALGLELCTSTQVLAGAVAGLGCHLDFAHVWTSTPCTPTTAQALMAQAKARARDQHQALCLDTCPLARNGRCEDGGAGAHRGVERASGVIDLQTCDDPQLDGYCCERGSDCSDCGPR